MRKIKDEIKNFVFSVDKRMEINRFLNDVEENEGISNESLKRQSEFSAPRYPEMIDIKKR
ncbi:MAG: hypothetical protein GX556_13865 [Fibrobacter sp.]|nr:hypothetical protein [Fibrobacter sp.]